MEVNRLKTGSKSRSRLNKKIDIGRTPDEGAPTVVVTLEAVLFLTVASLLELDGHLLRVVVQLGEIRGAALLGSG